MNSTDLKAEQIPSRKRDAIIALALFALALIIRLVYLIELSGTIYWDFLLVDAKSYHEIAVGQAASSTWLAPLYGWLLRAIYLITGSDLWAPRLLQAVIGSGTVVLVYLAALRIGGKTVGIIAGVIAAIYLPHVFYGAHLMKATWATFFLFLGFLLLLKWRDCLESEKKNTTAMFLLCFSSLSLGLSTLFRGNTLVLIPFVFAWILIISLRKTKSAAIIVPLFWAMYTIGPAIVIGINSAEEGGLVGLTTSAGFNFFEGNSEYATGYHADIPGFPRTAENEHAAAVKFAFRKMNRVSMSPLKIVKYYRIQALAWIASNPGAWIGLMFKKFYYFWNRLEIPDNYNYSFMAGRSIMLRIPFTGNWLIAPLAIAGIILFWPRKKLNSRLTTHDSPLLYVFILGYMFAVIIFYVTGRMRLGGAPFLIIFASLFIVEIAKRLRYRPKAAMPWIIVLAAACVFVWWPAPPSALGYEREHFVLATHAANDAEKARVGGDMRKAAALYDDAVKEYENALKYSAPAGGEILHRNALSISKTVANAYRKQSPDAPEAEKWYQREKRHAEALEKLKASAWKAYHK